MFSYYDLIACGTVFIISIISILSGIGGGSIYTAIMILIYKFDVIKAVPISIALIFSTSTVNIIYFLIKKEHKSQTNYPILIAIIPFLSCGSFVGTILVKIMPKIVTMLCIAVTMTFSVCKSYGKWKALRITEVVKTEEAKEAKQTEHIEMIDLEEQPIQQVAIKKADKSHNNVQPSLSGDSYKTLSLYILVLLLIVASEGAFSIGRKLVKICQSDYIIICVAQIVATILIGLVVYKFLQYDKSQKEQANYEFNSGDIEMNSKNFSLLAVLGLFVSVISSWNGTGGATIINPVLLTLGLLPSSVVATSCNFIWLGSLSSLINFALTDQIDYSYAVMLSVCAIIGTMVGLFAYNIIVNKIKKQSMLVAFLILIALLSLLLIIASMIVVGNLNDFSIQKLCT